MVCFAFFMNKLMAPHNPNPEKLTSYECGEETTGSAWLPFNSRFYVIALVFLLFDVEMVFVFPWAIVFGNHQLIAADTRWGWLALTEMFVFLGILILGLAYVWAKGDLDWIKPKPVIPTTDARIPQSLYDKLNLEQANFKVSEFKADAMLAASPALVNAPAAGGADASAPVKKPMFKPAFKKPANE